MATARTESMGPVMMGLNKQNGQLRGQPPKAVSQPGPHAVSTPPGKVPGGGGAPKPGGGPQEGGIRYVTRPTSPLDSLISHLLGDLTQLVLI